MVPKYSSAVVISKYCLAPFFLFRLDARRRTDLLASSMDSPMFANNVVINPRPTTQVNIVKSFPALDCGTKSPRPIVVRVTTEKYKESAKVHRSARPMMPVDMITQQNIAARVICVLLRCNVTSLTSNRIFFRNTKNCSKSRSASFATSSHAALNTVSSTLMLNSLRTSFTSSLSNVLLLSPVRWRYRFQS